jgi:hypothetical protein
VLAAARVRRRAPEAGEVEATVIVNDRPVRVRRADRAEGLWVSAADAERLSGWEVGPEGACQGARCVPLAPGLAEDGWLDLAGLARHLGQPVVHDRRHEVWVIGDAAEDLGDRLRSLEAPDWELPDLEGRRHSLAGLRGRKVFLVAWASW